MAVKGTAPWRWISVGRRKGKEKHEVRKNTKMEDMPDFRWEAERKG